MGLINRKVKRDADLAANGLRGTATIDELELLGRGEFQLSAKKVDAMMQGETTMTRVKIALRVTVAGREPYTVKTKLPVPMMEFTKLGVGGSVPVLVDPSDPDHLEIDWSGEIVEPTIEQRAEHDPVLKAALDRRVDPPPGS
jgi:hypothetical protein